MDASHHHPPIPTSTHIPTVAVTIMMMIIIIIIIITTIPRGLPRCEEEERRPGVLGSRGGKWWKRSASGVSVGWCLKD
jgi:hypothetical protein